MIDALGIADKLSTLSLSGLVIIALVGSYFKVWCWGSVVVELNANHAAQVAEMKAAHLAALADMEADYEKRILKYEAANTKWETMALRGVGLAEVVTGLAKKDA